MRTFYIFKINNCHELKNANAKSIWEKYVSIDKDLFVIDFNYKDYFYIREISC